MGDVRWEFAPGRDTLDVKAIPLCPPKISKHCSQNRLLPFGAPILGSTEASHFLLHTNSLNIEVICTINYFNATENVLREGGGKHKRTCWHFQNGPFSTILERAALLLHLEFQGVVFFSQSSVLGRCQMKRPAIFRSAREDVNVVILSTTKKPIFQLWDVKSSQPDQG
ncbi:hypothetical protein TNCV_29891 [Trichonephila clavipes]|nr:hypothetical protein TNCV_29891 [Trichonephila clavipes]